MHDSELYTSPHCSPPGQTSLICIFGSISSKLLDLRLLSRTPKMGVSSGCSREQPTSWEDVPASTWMAPCHVLTGQLKEVSSCGPFAALKGSPGAPSSFGGGGGEGRKPVMGREK